MISISLDEDELTPLLDRLSLHLSDMTHVMAGLGELMIEQTKERFKTGTSVDGSPWIPKSQTTKDRYARMGLHVAQTRTLWGPNDELRIAFHYEASPHSVEFGSALPYSAVMQFGARKGQFGTAPNGNSIPWGDIPARPYIGFNEEDVSVLVEELQGWLRKVVDQ